MKLSVGYAKKWLPAPRSPPTRTLFAGCCHHLFLTLPPPMLTKIAVFIMFDFCTQQSSLQFQAKGEFLASMSAGVSAQKQATEDHLLYNLGPQLTQSILLSVVPQRDWPRHSLKQDQMMQEVGIASHSDPQSLALGA